MSRCFVVMLLAGTAVCAQPPMQQMVYPWWDMPIARDLNLTEDQRNRIQTTVKEYRERLIDLRGAVEKADLALADCMNDAQPDTRRCSDVIDQSATARAELHRAVSQMGLKLRLVLTVEQWRELQRRRPMHRGNAPPAGRRMRPPER